MPPLYPSVHLNENEVMVIFQTLQLDTRSGFPVQRKINHHYIICNNDDEQEIFT